MQDFPGNYTDYRLYREMKQQQERKEKEQAAKQQANKPAENKNQNSTRARKLTYKEQKELEQLTADIETLEAEKATITEELSSGTLQGQELVDKSQRIGDIDKELDEKTERWMELSELA